MFKYLLMILLVTSFQTARASGPPVITKATSLEVPCENGVGQCVIVEISGDDGFGGFGAISKEIPVDQNSKNLLDRIKAIFAQDKKSTSGKLKFDFSAAYEADGDSVFLGTKKDFQVKDFVAALEKEVTLRQAKTTTAATAKYTARKLTATDLGGQ